MPKAFSAPNEVLRLRDLVTRTSFSKGIVFRLLYTLEKSGLVERAGKNEYRCVVVQRRKQKYKIGYAAQGTGYQFSQQVTASLKQEADRLDTVELLVLDSRYSPKTAQRNADVFVKERVDLAMEFQTDEIVAPIISAKYRKAKFPFIAIEVPHPGSIYFGANNYEARLIGGRALGKWAKQFWEGQADEIVLMELQRAGMVPRARLTGMLVGIREILPETEHCPVVFLDGDGLFESSWKAVRKYITYGAAKRTLIGGINDSSALGALRAYEEAGRAERCAVMGQNASPEALHVLSSKATPPAVFVKHRLVTAKNVEHLYPNDNLL